LITEAPFRAAMNAGGAFADDHRNHKSTIPAMATAALKGWRYLSHFRMSADWHRVRAARAALATCAPSDWGAAFGAVLQAAQAVNLRNPHSCDPTELRHQADLLRCIFGVSLFRSVVLDPAWLTPAVESLAKAIDAERKFDCLPILADAIEEAGCGEADILNHLRAPGPHMSGCFALHLILGRSECRAPDLPRLQRDDAR
jgi:hypothetical protein